MELEHDCVAARQCVFHDAGLEEKRRVLVSSQDLLEL